MRLKVFDRRDKNDRRKNDTQNWSLPERRQNDRRKGERRRRAAGLILGIASMMPLAHPTGIAQKFKPINTSSSSVQRESGNTRFLRQNEIFVPAQEAKLWVPPEFPLSLDAEQDSFAPLPEVKSSFTFADLVHPIAEEHEVDWRLVAAVIEAESNFNPKAVSPVGARGLMQLMPATAADYGVTLKEIHDPRANIEAGVKHLKRLINMYDGDIELVAAAYNAGQGNVAKFQGIPPFPETENYVKKVVANYNSWS